MKLSNLINEGLHKQWTDNLSKNALEIKIRIQEEYLQV